jgi:dTDP-4-amino-4,6-dideoxygalactose transaminase
MTQPIATQDLDAHHRPIQQQLEAAALRVISSGRYILGPEVSAFEKEVATQSGVARAVGVSSGTDALLAILMALDIGPGDEVVTTPFTFFATAGAIARLGARPVFADIDPDTLNLDPNQAAQRLGPRTRAVITVHLFGRIADSALLEAACRSRNVPLVEDAAQALDASIEGPDGPRRMGSLGRAAALSFFPSKNLGGFGDGGMVLTNDEPLADRLRTIRTHGAERKYHHSVVGGNFRLDELQAALLRVKLPHVPRWSLERRRVASGYRQLLAETPLGLPPADPGCVWNQFVVRVPEGQRDRLAAHLADQKIATAIYYPEPLHLQPCFRALGHAPGDLPHAERACREALALPIYPELSDEAIERVAAAVKSFFHR